MLDVKRNATRQISYSKCHSVMLIKRLWNFTCTCCISLRCKWLQCMTEMAICTVEYLPKWLQGCIARMAAGSWNGTQRNTFPLWSNHFSGTAIDTLDTDHPCWVKVMSAAGKHWALAIALLGETPDCHRNKSARSSWQRTSSGQLF